MQTTPVHALPYPEPTDSVDVATNIENLAESVEAVFVGQAVKHYKCVYSGNWFWMNLSQEYAVARVAFTTTGVTVIDVVGQMFFKLWQSVEYNTEVTIRHNTLGVIGSHIEAHRNAFALDIYPTTDAYAGVQIPAGSHVIEMRSRILASNVAPAGQYWGANMIVRVEPGTLPVSTFAAIPV
ncbi:MAG: hypothetical protein H0T54_09830 [Geodermatophilaceae bacterium]|nr:hypothetical protein [Geodermatophilaceae bacterium]